MKTIQFGFKAFDPHELLCHFIASEAGLYSRENLQVELVDITFIEDSDLPKDMFQVSCGAALSSALRGKAQRILFIATDKPMFWIYSRNEIKSLQQLKNATLAPSPTSAPPHHLANMILNKSGINIEKETRLLPARDDMARFGLLKSGNVDAAVISSAIPPAKFERAGFNTLCFFGNEIRIPTTGLAIDQSFLQTLIAILKESLVIIHEDPNMLASVLQGYFDVDDALKNTTAQLFQQYFTEDGKSSDAIVQDAVNSLCRSLSISSVPDWRQIYIFSN